MSQRPFEIVTEFFKEKVSRDRKMNEFIHNQTDNLITWVIGFAFTGFLLVVGNIKSMELLKMSLTKPVIIFILLTITLGIGYRYVSFLVMTFEKKLDDYYAGLFGDYDFPPLEIDDEIKNADYDTILRRLREDFKEDIIAQPDLPGELKDFETKKLKEHYENLCEYSMKTLNIAVEYIAEIEYKTHRIDKKTNIRAFEKSLHSNDQLGYHALNWMILRSTLFTLCLLSFVIAICIAGISILFM